MSNHIHVIWQPQFGYTPSGVQASFMKYTAQQLKRALEKSNPDLLESFRVNKEDRIYQIWKRRPLSIDLISETVFNQKLDYIHFNPVKAGLSINAEDYYYSSAEFYHNGKDKFGILTHHSGN